MAATILFDLDPNAETENTNTHVRIRRFLVLGTTEPTYYTRRPVTYESATGLIDILKEGKGGLILQNVLSVHDKEFCPSKTPIMFAMALCCRARYFTRDDLNAEQSERYTTYTQSLTTEALKNLAVVCKTSSELFEVLNFSKKIMKKATANTVNPENGKLGIKGWGRSFKNAVIQWYNSQRYDGPWLSYDLKLFPRNGKFSPRDVLRLTHLRPADATIVPALLLDHCYHFAVRGTLVEDKNDVNYQPPGNAKYVVTKAMLAKAKAPDTFCFIRGYMRLKKLEVNVTNVEEAKLLIFNHKMKKIHMPRAWLDFPDVWMHLIFKMPVAEILCNFVEIAKLRTLDDDPDNTAFNYAVAVKLLNGKATLMNDYGNHVNDDDINPLAALLVMKMYANEETKPEPRWIPNQRIINAFNEAFKVGKKRLANTEKRYLLAFDVGSNMNSFVPGTSVTARYAAAVIANIILAKEKNVQTVYFGNHSQIVEAGFTRGMSVDVIEARMRQFCDIVTEPGMKQYPMKWAREQNSEVDVFIVFSTTAFGTSDDVYQALEEYREKAKKPTAKLIFMGLTAKKLQIAQPEDPGMLDICGVNPAVLTVIRSFVRDDI